MDMHEIPLPPQRELRGGRDYPIWPYLKWGHASRCAGKLHADFSMWRGSLGEETRAEFSPDRREVTFYASIRSEPPTFEWSLVFGDAIHNYRSALDSLAWSMAHMDGNRPDHQDEKRIYFPLTRSVSEFNKLAKTSLRSVPGFILERLQSVQPYHGGHPNKAIGAILHDLDIADKHRSSIELVGVAADKTTYGVAYRYEDLSNKPDPGTEDYEWLGDEGPVHDGQPIARMRFQAPVETAEVYNLPLVLAIDHGGERRDALALLGLIDRQLAVTFRRVERGFLPDDAEFLGMSATELDDEAPAG